MQKLEIFLLALIFGLFTYSLAVADDMPVLSEKQLKCVDTKMSKWQKQRDKDVSSECKALAKKGEECRLPVGIYESFEEDALKTITAKCKKMYK